jgi:hypothetical protein
MSWLPQFLAMFSWIRSIWKGEGFFSRHYVTKNPYPQFLRRRIFLWVPIGFLLFTIFSVSCSRDGAVTTAKPISPSNFKVAMVLPGPKNDGSWSQSGYEGLKLIETELGAQIAYTDNTGELSGEEIKSIIRDWTWGRIFRSDRGSCYRISSN